MGKRENDGHLSKYVSSFGAWALAFGCCVGWGAFVMPGTTFLPVSGPAGTVIGLGIGALLMVILAVNYHYMMKRNPGSGGAYTYASKVFGSDHGFLTGWFLILSYIVVFWGNATALPMIARNLLGNVFQFGLHYTLFGYDVYFGEILLSACVMLFVAMICLRPRLALGFQIFFAVLLAAGIVICAVMVFSRVDDLSVFKPDFAPDVPAAAGIFSLVSLAPWAFVGFETISHSSREFRFEHKKSISIMVIALVCALAAYVLLALVSIAHLPDGQSNWVGYLSQIGSFSGISALPTFESAQYAMGNAGIIGLGITAFAAICTGLIGFATASSRLLYSLSKDGLIPEKFSKVNSKGVPSFAILMILILSIPVLFLGRTAINWLVDVTTICIIIAYGYVSGSALKVSHKEGNKRVMIAGIVGVIIACAFAVVFLVPNLLMIRTMSAESYLLVAIWAILGLLWFRHMFKKGTSNLKNPSIVVWGAFLALIIYTSLLWVIQTAAEVEITTSQNIENYYEQKSIDFTGDSLQDSLDDSETYVQDQLAASNDVLRRSSMIQIGFIIVAMFIIFSIYNIMQKRTRNLEVEKARAEENSRAKSMFLSNMSHDIRTPMNAIIGMTDIANKNIDDKERVQDCLTKITLSSRHLLGVINDVLDMSKIESGKMVLNPEKMSLQQTMETMCDIVRSQAEEKDQIFEMFVSDILSEEVYCDSVRLNQVLLNFLSNAIKYTPDGGLIQMSLWQKPSQKGDDYVETHFEVKDNGIGMSKEYQEKLFTSFEREDSLRVHKTQGTGLGLAITKYIVDAMEGSIEVISEMGAGSSFHVTVDLKRMDEDTDSMRLPEWQILVVDANERVCSNAAAFLKELGTIPVTCSDGEEAVRLSQEASAKAEGFFAAIVDHKLQGMDGIEVIAKMKESLKENMPACLIAAYDWAEAEEDLHQPDVSGFIGQPFFKSTLYRELNQLQAENRNGNPVQNKSEREFDITGKIFLLAEDNDLNAEIASMILGESGAKVERAEDGKIAAEMFERSNPGYYDAVFMDLRMPNMNGLEATQAIRKMDREDAAKIPIIAMTTDAFADDVEKCLAAGMNAHLAKPIDIEKLKSTIMKLV